MFKKFWDYVGQSVWTKIGGKISTTRIQSYLILGSVLTSTLIFLSIDIVNAIIKWKSGNIYAVPTEHITLFGMVLAHHLALLGINKNSETKTAQANAAAPTKEEPAKEEPVKDKPKDADKPKEENKDVPPIKDDGDLEA
jgi:hypothetical protein